MQNEKSFDTGELTLNYFDSGTSGAALVMLHGMTGMWQAWYGLIPRLTADWHVYAPDLRGHGKTGHAPDESYRNLDYARDVIAFLKCIDEPAVLVGHSLGAMVAIVAAAQYPVGVSGVLLIDPPLFTASASVELHTESAQWFNLILSMVADNPTYEQILAKTRERMPEADDHMVQARAYTIAHTAPGTVQAALNNRLWDGVDLSRTLQQIECPIRLIYGDWAHGGAIRTEDVTAFKAICPLAALVEIPNASHQIPFEHPDVVLSELKTLLPSD